MRKEIVEVKLGAIRWHVDAGEDTQREQSGRSSRTEDRQRVSDRHSKREIHNDDDYRCENL